MSKKGRDKGRELRYWDIGDGVAYFRWSDAVKGKAEDERKLGKSACQDEDGIDRLVEKHGRDFCPDPPP